MVHLRTEIKKIFSIFSFSLGMFNLCVISFTCNDIYLTITLVFLFLINFTETSYLETDVEIPT